MPYGTASKYFSSDMPGAPSIFADAGGLVGWLDAVLVTGYGAAVVSQIVVTDGVAVATTNLGHSLRKWVVALNENTGHEGLNGEHRVTDVVGAGYTFEVIGVPNGTYTGGSVKVAPLGFEISYSATNRRIYRSKDTARRNAVSLYVDDTNTVSGWNIGTNKALAQAKLVCDVGGIDAYTTLDTAWWFKSATTSGTLGRPWIVAGDTLGFYSAVDAAGTGQTIASSHFMQINSLAAGDQFATLLEGSTPTTTAVVSNVSGIGAAGACMNAMTHGTRRVARGLSQSGAAVDLRYLGLGMVMQASSPPYGWLLSGSIYSTSGVQMYGLAAVNPADSGMVLGQNILAIHSPTGSTSDAQCTARGTMPGLFSVPAIGSFPMTPSITESPGGLNGSVLLALPAFVGGPSVGASSGYATGSVGGYYVDITRGWR